ncbi:MAG: general secretion pathway protein GspK [Phycisphaeraceae bacterium]|nr:general secretion pathway protein GspK [Phycisphaeraceae bacterium]
MSTHRRAVTTFIVLWTIAVSAVILAALQSAAWRGAAAGREAVARSRAKWAARAGVEAQIAALTFSTINPDPNSAFAVRDELARAASGSLGGATFTVAHDTRTGRVEGAADAHAKLNINILSRDSMLLLPYMDETIADSILDWIDGDDEPNDLGAELGQYLSLKHGYMPRNAPLRSLGELELVLGVRPEYVRGEDWNQNNLLDPNEDDGNLTWPPDNPDGKLDGEWSRLLTAVSEDGGLAASGLARLDLTLAEVEEIQKRLQVDAQQAQAIADAALTVTSMADFIRTPLRDLVPQGATLLSGRRTSTLQNLTNDQLALLLDETTLGDPIPPRSGKLNINTCDDEVIEYLAEISPGVADALILERNARAGGFSNLIDLLNVPAITNEVLASLYDLIDVRSNVYVVTSRGRDEGTGVEVEIVATIDRSTLPIVVREIVIR